MARDRLAAMRAQQINDSTNSYPMADVRSSETQLTSSTPPPGDMPAFYATISSIQDSLRTFNDNVARIGDLRSRSLNNMDDVAAQRDAAHLDELVEDTRALSATLKQRIKVLVAQGGTGRDGEIRRQQTALVKSKFMEAIQNYQSVEQQCRTKYKQRVERQFKIVKPDATPEEVKAVVNDEQGDQIFSQALMNSRYTESAYREVQERHEAITTMTRTLKELAELFETMGRIVFEQDKTINDIGYGVEQAEIDTKDGGNELEKAKTSALAARKKRWICFFIIIVILAVAAIIIGILVSRSKNTSS